MLAKQGTDVRRVATAKEAVGAIASYLGTCNLPPRLRIGADPVLAALPWREGMTVVDALGAAAKHPHGITFESRGRGASALVTRIGDLKNEGTGRNWLYSVNGKLANVGAGAYKLSAGDVVLWEFKVYRYN